MEGQPHIQDSSSFTEEDLIECLNNLCVFYGEILWGLWVEMGIDKGKQRALRQKTVINCITERFETMIAEEREHKTKLIEVINRNYHKLRSLSKELDEDFHEPSEDLGIVQLEKALRTLLEEFKEKKAGRLAEHAVVQKKDQALAEYLDEDPFPLSLVNIPSEEEQNALEAHIRQLSELKLRRRKIFAEVKSEIIQIMDELGVEPEDSFERAVVCETDEYFVPLSEQRLSSVQGVLNKLRDTKLENMQKAKKMRLFIQNISRKLGLDNEENSGFLEQFSGHSTNDISELQFRVDELELLKGQHVKRLIASSREELSELWDRCLFSQDQRSPFAPYFSDECTSELLEQHENEVEKMRDYYAQNESLLQMVHQRQSLWRKKMELEKKAKDPNRFKVKSTEFLKEEKDRKHVEYQLPKIEACLEEAIENRRLMTSEEFLVGGIPYRIFMKNQASAYEKMVEREKAEKTKAKKQLLISETKYGSTPLTKFNTTKRKAPGASDSNLTKKHKFESSGDFSRTSMRSNLTRSTSHRQTSSRGLTIPKNIPRQDNSFITGLPVINVNFCNADDQNPFLNPKDVNANSTLQSDNISPRFKEHHQVLKEKRALRRRHK